MSALKALKRFNEQEEKGKLDESVIVRNKERLSTSLSPIQKITSTRLHVYK